MVQRGGGWAGGEAAGGRQARGVLILTVLIHRQNAGFLPQQLLDHHGQTPPGRHVQGPAERERLRQHTLTHTHALIPALWGGWVGVWGGVLTSAEQH